MKKISIKTISMMGLFAALCYIGTLFHITIPISGNVKTMIHFGNIFCLIAALTLGPIYGGISASVGMGLFDLLNGWATYAPSTIILKFFIAFFAGTMFKALKKLDIRPRVFISTAIGMLFNIIFDPIVNFLVSKYIFNLTTSISKIVAAWSSIATVINAVVAIIAASIIYLSLKRTKIIDKL